MTMNLKHIRNAALVLVATLAAVFGTLEANASRITLGGLTTLNLSTHLDPMFVDLYDLRERISTASYTGSSSGNLGFGMTPYGRVSISSTAGGSPLHLSNGTTDTGGYLHSPGITELLLGGGASYNSFSSPNYVMNAKSTVASGLLISNGGVKFWGNTGLTAGTTFNMGVLGQVDSSGLLMTSSAPLGYGVGSGGAVTQATSKSTGVTLNTPSMQITMSASSLAASTTVMFTVTNSVAGANDTTVCNRKTGGTAGAYQVWVDSEANGSFVVAVRNTTGGSLAEAVVLQCNVVRGSVS